MSINNNPFKYCPDPIISHILSFLPNLGSICWVGCLNKRFYFLISDAVRLHLSHQSKLEAYTLEKVIQLFKCKYPQNTFQDEALKSVLPKLTDLAISTYHRGKKSLGQLLVVIAKWPYLSLDLSMQETHFDEHLKNFSTRLKVLRVAGVPLIDKSQIIKSLDFPYLEELFIQSNHLYFQMDFFSRTPNVKKITLAYLDLNRINFKHFCSLKHLEEISIYHCEHFSAEKIRFLQDCPKLRSLHIYLKGSSQLQTFKNIEKSLLQKLNTLEIRDDFMINYRMDFMISLKSGIESCSNLEIFRVESSKIDDTWIQLLIAHCPRLKIFELGSSSVTVEGIRSVLQNVEGISSLDLNRLPYSLSDIGLEYFQNVGDSLNTVALPENTTLEEFSQLIPHVYRLRNLSIEACKDLDMKNIFPLLKAHCPSLEMVIDHKTYFFDRAADLMEFSTEPESKKRKYTIEDLV